jgi:hypothetical protein
MKRRREEKRGEERRKGRTENEEKFICNHQNVSSSQPLKK